MSAVDICGCTVGQACAEIRSTLAAAAGPVLIDTDQSPSDWERIVHLLRPEGITIAYDHDAGYPVARREAQS